ncbi:hypothetical protein [Paraburkholderia caballeronis]|uniref:hypothetical protein n=1 Tax=Paraburkholderia caballeronis TaxID=416943 RepID=UPI001FCC9FC5|nr:hypothetical protein [Paraburkholderia caballeronis]
MSELIASPPSMIGERALTLKEAAALLRVSYDTAWTNRVQWGFFKAGRVWRVWPNTLRERLQGYNPPLTGAGGKEKEACQSAGAKALTPGSSISARQAAAELDKLLAQPIERRRRSYTTS